jgi:hypothetical protein
VKTSPSTVKKSSSGDNLIPAEFMKVREEKFGRLESTDVNGENNNGKFPTEA